MVNHWSFVAVTEQKYYTIEEALLIAEKYGLTDEITYLMDHGHTPSDALAEWDLL